MLRLSLLILVALSLGAGRLGAQQIAVTGGEQERAVEILREILQREQFLLLHRDTVLPVEFHTPGDLLILDADVRLEGVVDGEVAVAGGVFFIRPGARVAGPIAAVGGQVYPSGLATVGEIVEISPGSYVEVTVAPPQFAVRVVPPPPPPAVVLPGAFGLRVPTYDRVNGLSVGWGPEWRLLREVEGPTLSAWVAYRTARQAVDGAVMIRVPLGAGIHLLGEVARTAATQDAWISGDLGNTLAALTLGNDYRNYYLSEFAALTLARPIPPFAALLGEGRLSFGPHLSLLASRDYSLPTAQTWSLFGGEGMRRPNPEVDDGTLVSLRGGTEVAWQGSLTAFRGELLIEQGLPGPGDFRFTRWVAEGRWNMQALWDHRIALLGRGMGSISDTPAPRQRWSYVGGAYVLPTFALGEFRGDNLIFLQSFYEIPLAFVTVPLLGSPDFVISHSTGMAWITGTQMPAWEQNLGIGLRILLLEALVYLDPARGLTRPTISIGLLLPG